MSLSLFIYNISILSIEKHKRIDEDTVDDGMKQNRHGTLCLKDRTGDGIYLGGGYDKKEKSGL